MSLTKKEWISLEKKASYLRHKTAEVCVWAKGAHIGGAYSSADVLTALYYYVMNFNKDNYLDDNRDRLIISKGHAGVITAPILADIGILDESLLPTYNHTGSPFGVHLDKRKVPGLEASTGSLGHGLSIGLGLAMAARLKKKDYFTYVLLGDGECDEGSIWEAAMSVAHFKVTNLITIVDRNKCMIDGRTEDVMSLEPFADKWRAFGFDVIEVDGHNMDEIITALLQAKANKTDKPICIILNTFKGEGVGFMKDNYKWHYGTLNEEQLAEAFRDLDEYEAQRIARAEKEGK